MAAADRFGLAQGPQITQQGGGYLDISLSRLAPFLSSPIAVT